LAQHTDVSSRLRSPLRRIGRPEEVGGAVVYLTSAAGAYCTGVILPVEGGIQTTR
jgi:NAD(P)-dependent dehydrogenase (short-subunit alcohol dehydrogenase family)